MRQIVKRHGSQQPSNAQAHKEAKTAREGGFDLVLSAGIEPASAPSEGAILSIERRELTVVQCYTFCMKTLTCAQMGGMCDTPISGNTKDEIMMGGMQHLEVAHPEMAAQIKATPKDDPAMAEWSQKFDAMYDAAPEQ